MSRFRSFVILSRVVLPLTNAQMRISISADFDPVLFINSIFKEVLMARVQVINETTIDDPDSTDWTLWFQWCRYLYDDGEIDHGYRFIWRRPQSEGGGLQAARGQARIPSIAVLEQLVAKAKKEGWGENNMSWHRVIIADSELAGVSAGGLMQGFSRAFLEAGLPNDAAVFHGRNEAMDHIYYFSPTASAIAENTLKEFSAVACPKPENLGDFKKVRL